MPPKLCPTRLQRLIDTEPHALRLILRALQDRRHNKGPETFALESTSRVTINLDNYKVTVRTELALALAEIDPPSAIDLLRECPICQVVFWAGRDDKKACDKHAGQHRKSNQRQRQTAEAEQLAAEGKDAQLKKTLRELSRTGVALLNAIVIDGNHVFYKIDNAAWSELDDDPTIRRIPSYRIVRRTLDSLVKRGYLTRRAQNDPDEDRYFPERELINAWTEIRRK